MKKTLFLLLFVMERCRCDCVQQQEKGNGGAFFFQNSSPLHNNDERTLVASVVGCFPVRNTGTRSLTSMTGVSDVVDVRPRLDETCAGGDVEIMTVPVILKVVTWK